MIAGVGFLSERDPRICCLLQLLLLGCLSSPLLVTRHTVSILLLSSTSVKSLIICFDFLLSGLNCASPLHSSPHNPALWSPPSASPPRPPAELATCCAPSNILILPHVPVIRIPITIITTALPHSPTMCAAIWPPPRTPLVRKSMPSKWPPPASALALERQRRSAWTLPT